VPAPSTPEQGKVLGKRGEREEKVLGKRGTREAPTTPVRLFQATETEEGGELAQTGFNVLMLFILGGVAVAGSALLFWRTREN
jgi:LPXTG-motif cell wall-anchored protein